MDSVVQADCLVSNLLSSPAACDLLQSLQPDTERHAGVALSDGEEQLDSMVYMTADAVLMRTTELFEECQQKTSTSSDTTLALSGLDEQDAVHLQVHRCILASRCAFFQALFSTTWTEPNSEYIEISTEECSGELAAAVIGYLYTGSIEANASNAAEIMSLANLWQLPGLIDLVSQQLTAGPCQGFRRPTAPSDSLVTSVPAMAAFAKAALDGGIEYESVQGLYQACVAWLAKHLLLVWPTKAYAHLPLKIRHEVRAQAKAVLNAVNVLPQLEQADKLIARMPPAKWAAEQAIAAKSWRMEVLQYISENFPKVALTSAFVERLQSEWTLEHLQQIAEAVKVEYGASRAGYALEVYLGLQRLQSSAETGSFSEAAEVKQLLDELKDHCWSYILRNWHLLQRTPTYKISLPLDQRQRLAADVKLSLSEITTLDSPGDQSQSMGFSVLWDASNTQPDAAASNALTPDGKRPVSKATEKRRRRLAEEQEQRRQAEEKQMLQQQRQQTIREIRQRQAAAAAETASEAASREAASSRVQSQTASSCSPAGNEPSRRADSEAMQDTFAQRAARQQPAQARAGLRASGHEGSSEVSKAGAASRSACSRAVGSSSNVGARPRDEARSTGKRQTVSARPGLRAGSQSGAPADTALRTSHFQSYQQDSTSPSTPSSSSAFQQRPASRLNTPQLPGLAAQGDQPEHKSDNQAAQRMQLPLQQQQRQGLPNAKANDAARGTFPTAARALVQRASSSGMTPAASEPRQKVGKVNGDENGGRRQQAPTRSSLQQLKRLSLDRGK